MANGRHSVVVGVDGRQLFSGTQGKTIEERLMVPSLNGLLTAQDGDSLAANRTQSALNDEMLRIWE